MVVKLGTGVLTDSRKQPDLAQMEQLVAQMAEQRKAGRKWCWSPPAPSAPAWGCWAIDKRPADLAELQACAAVGQSRLMATYEKLFGAHGLAVAQILLTHDDLEHHERHLNARNTLVTLLRHGVVPIINENDVVSFTELKFGDNDKLSALVASLLPGGFAGDPDHRGWRDRELRQSQRHAPFRVIEKIDAAIEEMAGGTDSATAVGGMTSKIQAAKIAVRSGIPLVIASGRKKNVLARVVAGEDRGDAVRAASHAGCAGANAGSPFSIIPRARCLWMRAPGRRCARMARASCRPASRAAKASSRPAKSCASATWTARSSPAASAVSLRRNRGPQNSSGVEVVHRDNLVIL